MNKVIPTVGGTLAEEVRINCIRFANQVLDATGLMKVGEKTPNAEEVEKVVQSWMEIFTTMLASATSTGHTAGREDMNQVHNVWWMLNDLEFTIDVSIAKVKGNVEVWLEAGQPGEHDINLDCGGKTYEEALLKLGKLVKKHYPLLVKRYLREHKATLPQDGSTGGAKE